jgi:hypothetical protein
LASDSQTDLDSSLEHHHKEETDLYQRQRGAHERMKHHHQAMAKVAMMGKGLKQLAEI